MVAESHTLWRGASYVYMGQTYANAALSGAVLRGVYKLFGWDGGRPPRAAQQELARRLKELMDEDWANARAGYYPVRFLFESPLVKHGRRLPDLFVEAPKIARRRKRAEYDALPGEIDRSKYPRYYLRTFHWQTDGWFSKRSAELYDASVELLFGGTADIMRRMVIPPLADGTHHTKRPAILDVACGTGRFLKMLDTLMPGASLTGLDLSEAYLGHAEERLADRAELVWGNAESMPFEADRFDAVSSVFLFHELPRAARRNVMKEMARVVKPGGSVVVLDSAQLVESERIAFFLERFPEVYHEPYYRDYLKDDLAAIAREAGLEVVGARPHAVSKLVWAKKPQPA